LKFTLELDESDARAIARALELAAPLVKKLPKSLLPSDLAPKYDSLPKLVISLKDQFAAQLPPKS